MAISDDARPAEGNLDGGGQSLSQQALAAQGITSGGTVTHGGLSYTWPDVRRANRTTRGRRPDVPFTGRAPARLPRPADYGDASGTGLITYTDGTTQTYTLVFPDWWSGGGDTVATFPYINTPTGRQNQTVHLYMATVKLQAGKTVQLVTLPDISQGATRGNVATHLRRHHRRIAARRSSPAVIAGGIPSPAQEATLSF